MIGKNKVMSDEEKTYSTKDAKVTRDLERSQEKEFERLRRIQIEKDKEIKRRRLYAKKYEPKQCLGDPITGDYCARFAPPGSTVCELHGGTTANMRAMARTRLLCLVEPALKTLLRAMSSNELSTGVRAALGVLDRTGMGPHAVLEVQDKPEDLSRLTTEELLVRYRRMTQMLMQQGVQEPGAELNTIDGETVPDKGSDSVH